MIMPAFDAVQRTNRAHDLNNSLSSYDLLVSIAFLPFRHSIGINIALLQLVADGIKCVYLMLSHRHWLLLRISFSEAKQGTRI